VCVLSSNFLVLVFSIVLVVNFEKMDFDKLIKGILESVTEEELEAVKKAFCGESPSGLLLDSATALRVMSVLYCCKLLAFQGKKSPKTVTPFKKPELWEFDWQEYGSCLIELFTQKNSSTESSVGVESREIADLISQEMSQFPDVWASSDKAHVLTGDFVPLLVVKARQLIRLRIATSYVAAGHGSGATAPGGSALLN